MKPGDTTAGPAQPHPVNVAAGAIVAQLDHIEQLLRDILLNSEQESDFDQTFVVGGNMTAPTAVNFQLPRSIHHVEVTLSATASTEVALLDGQLSTTQASAQHGHSAAVTGNSNAICTTGGGTVTARDYLGQGGWMTAYFAAANPGSVYANIRIRSLDETQARPQRT